MPSSKKQGENKMKDKNPIRALLAVLAASLIFFSPMMIGHIYDNRHPVTTLTGHDALVQIHGYLGCLLFELAAMPFTSALSGFVGSLVYKAGNPKFKGERRWSPAAVVILAVTGSAVMLFIPSVSGVDLQQKLNGYKGLPIVQTARMYNACGKDLESGDVIAKEIVNAETGYDIFSKYKGSGTGRRYSSRYSTQYSLSSSGEPLAQISGSDRRRMEILFMTSERHSAEFYKNSGFIASFDGYDTMSFDLSTMFTLEYDGEYIRRTSSEGDNLQNNITLYMEYDGEQEYNSPIGSRTEFYFPRVKKGTVCYMRIWHNDNYLRVSNIIEF